MTPLPPPSAQTLQDPRCVPCKGGCGRYIWRGNTPPEGTLPHWGRNLCARCHGIATANDTLLDFDRFLIPVEDMIEDIEAGGRTPVDLLAAWGRNARAVHRALHRAGRRDLARIFASLAYQERKAAGSPRPSRTIKPRS